MSIYSKVAEIKDQLDEVVVSMNSIYDNNDIDINSLKADYRNDDTIIFFASTDDDYAVALSDATYAKFATYVQAGLLSMKETGSGKFNKLLSHKVSLLKDVDDKGTNNKLESISKEVGELSEELDTEVKKKEEAEKTRAKIIDDETSEVEAEKVDEVSDPDREETKESSNDRSSILDGVHGFISKMFPKMTVSNENPVFDKYGNYLGDVDDDVKKYSLKNLLERL